MIKVRKAVIPVAGHGTRMFPFTKAVKKEWLPLVDQTRTAKPLIQLIVEEAVESGIEKVCLVVKPQDVGPFMGFFRGKLPSEIEGRICAENWSAAAYQHLMELGNHVAFATQEKQEGFGHAIYCARAWVGNEPFLVLLGDHVHIPRGPKRCARELLDVFERYEGRGSVTAVKRTPPELLSFFGTISGRPMPDDPRVYEVSHMKEKPTIDYARQHFRMPTLPEDCYLTFFGQHVFTPDLFECLHYMIEKDLRERGEFQLTSAMELLLEHHPPYYAFETTGLRCDLGIPEGFVRTVIELAKHGGILQGQEEAYFKSGGQVRP